MDKFVIKAAGSFAPDYTGPFMGKVQFNNGIGYSDKLIWVKLAVLKGCFDVTPPDVRQRLMNRPLNRILVIRNAAYGDGLIITPALLALREKYPRALIHLFGRTDSRIVYEGCPYIDAIVNVRETELGVLFDDYDEVFDMVHSIECRPEADYMNALDVACDIMGTHRPSNPVPFYKHTEEELTKAQTMLTELGVDPNEEYIILQAEATAKVRTLPPTTSLAVANHFAQQGYRVLCVGHDLPLMHTKLSECPECHSPAALTSPNMQPQQHFCSNCGKQVLLTPKPNHPKVTFLHSMFQKYPARVHFSLASKARLLITVDSAWSHLAAAYRRPSVIIFSNYHPFTRTQYYDTASIVTPDYEKDVHCGPCNSLTGYCHMHPDKLAPCTTTIKPEQIIKAAEEQLKGASPLYQEMRDTPPFYFNPTEVRPCPICGSKEYWQITAKRDVLYVRCHNCQSIYTAKYPDQIFWDSLQQKVERNPHYRPTRINKPEEILSGMNHILKQISKPPVPKDQKIVDLVGPISDFHCGRASLSARSSIFVQMAEEETTQIGLPLILSIEALQEKENPRAYLQSLYDRMSPDSQLFLICPTSDVYTGVNSWEGLNAVVAGLNTVLPSKKGLGDLIKEIGFKEFFFSTNKVNCMVVIIK